MTDKREQQVYSPDELKYLRTGVDKLGGILEDEGNPDFWRAVDLIAHLNRALEEFLRETNGDG